MNPCPDNAQGPKFLPQLRDQSQEWRYVNDEIRQGRKLVRVFFSVTAFSPKGKGDTNERVLKSVYRAAGWGRYTERTQIYAKVLPCLRRRASGEAV